VPIIPFATEPPHPGQTCVAVGHPAAGLLWTYRSCEISGLGVLPDDLANVVMPRLAVAGGQRTAFEEQLQSLPKHQIVLSSCGINPGDSGGPLVDDSGALLGVTFATPADPALAKFGYHIHPKEVREFLASIPERPMILVPDAWDIGPQVRLVDLMGQGKPQTLIAGTTSPEEVLFDLDGDTPNNLLARSDLASLVGQRRFDAEAALHVGEGKRIAFYDTDNKDGFDLILQASDDGPTTEYRLGADGNWTVRTTNAPWFDPSRIRDPKQANRLKVLVSRLRGRDHG
jgi:hypothetical protein